MSRTARAVPTTEPETLDRPPARAAVAHRHLLDPPARPPRAHQQLQRVAERAVGDAQGQQGVPARDADRGDVVHGHPPAPQQGRDHRVPGAGVPGPHPGAGRHPAADGQIRPAGAHRVGEDGQGRGVEGAVAVQHGHQVGTGVP